ncbi:zinc finger CCCH domain-containing protein 3 [Elysia marginata]|uniref:Zinc finger CCCH domain-containing protein 3 n=1 Tax=Elysia marginata TaxID=1093978 RepID=A0AAV4FBS8_9GAST|nr:zinc finger CCCH domain-containing protein 3 [Elysia marginata]
MEFKIRYMKNDIEFKQSQILNKKLLSAQTRNPSLCTNISSVHKNFGVTTELAKKNDNLVSTSGHKNESHICHNQIVSNINISQGPHTMLKTNLSSAATSNLKKSEKNMKPLEVLSSPKSSTSRVSVSSVQSSSDSSNCASGPAQATCNQTDNFAFTENKTHQYTNAPTTSVFQRLGELKSTNSPKPIYVSPTKTQAIWYHSNEQSSFSTLLDKRQALLSTISKRDGTPCVGPSKMQNSESNMLNMESASKYKLVKSSHLTQGAAAATKRVPDTKSSSHYVSSGSREQKNTHHSDYKTFQHRSEIKTPKSKVSRKFVSKYKVARLSPHSVLRVSPQFLHKQASEKFKHVAPDVASDKHNVVSTPNSKNPKREIVMAAKLVSKYRLKRLLPTAGSNISQQMSPHQSKTLAPTSFSAPVLSEGNFSSKDKLGYNNQLNSCISHPTPSQSKTLNTYTSLSLKKSDHVQGKEICDSSGQNITQHRYVLDRRKRRSSEFKRRVINQHKLDRRPLKSSSSEHLTKVTAKLMAKKRNKHRWVTPTASFSSGLIGMKTQQASNSRFKWRKSSSSGSNPSHSRGSQFKWLKQRPHIQPSMLHLHRKDRRDPMWMTKSNLVIIRGRVYNSKWQTAANKPRKHSLIRGGSEKPDMKLITLRGAHFHADSHGKKLCRAGLATTNHPNKSKVSALQRRSRSQGKTVDESSILAASRVVHRSIVVAAAKFKKDNTKWSREKQHCMFFTRFGKCHRGEKCKYVHDPEKIAVCTRFLRGKCDVTRCQFSHNASEHKMPVCLHYLQGLCSRDNCPYLHVRVNPDAPVCKDFHHGYCSLGRKVPL